MPTSDARVAANRRNAQRSTGPKTAEGKASSRQNALKHGLTATVVDLDEPGDQLLTDPDAVMSREWLHRQVQRTVRRIDRGERIEDRLRLQAVWRASATWEEDRRLDAENLAVHLQREPSRTVARLRQTAQGCDWLIEQWDALALAADSGGDSWTEDQTRLAHDLLGTPAAARTESAFHPDDEATPRRAALAERQIAELRACQMTALEADEIAQVQAAGDLVDLPTPDLARLRRYDTALHRRLQWLITALQMVGTAPALVPPVAAPTPSAVPASSLPPSPVEPTRNEPNDPAPRDETKPTAAAEVAPPTPPGSTWARPELASMVPSEVTARPVGSNHRRSA